MKYSMGETAGLCDLSVGKELKTKEHSVHLLAILS